MSAIDTRVTCHTCSGKGHIHWQDDVVCERCDGEGLRDAREAAAHQVVVALEFERDAAAQTSDKWWRETVAKLRDAKDAWEEELTRLANERAECEGVKAAGEMRGAA